MDVLFVGYPKCSTSRGAEKWLQEKGVGYTFRHIVEETPTVEELDKWSQGKELKRFFNTSGMQYRELRLKDKLPKMDRGEQLALLASNGMLIKRPIVVMGETVLLGFKEEEYERIFG